MGQPLSYLEISSEALNHNARWFRRRLGRHQSLIAVVKANAYGHGLAQFVEALDGVVDGYQIDDIEELRALRTLTSRRALVLGYVQPTDLAEAIALQGELAIYDIDRILELMALASTEEPARVHLCLDAYLGRDGLTPGELPEILALLQRCPQVRVVGVYSHYSDLGPATDHTHSELQREAFYQMVEQVLAAGFTNFDVHLSATYGTLHYEGGESPHHLVRVGIGLYGLTPPAVSNAELQPALQWITHLAQVKELPAGYPIGYSRTAHTSRPTLLGLIPQGYADGYSRDLSNCGHVLIRGQRCPVLGRVCMNMFTVDVTDLPDPQVGDAVVLLGTQGSEQITAEQLASTTDTNVHEVVARLNPGLDRFLVV